MFYTIREATFLVVSRFYTTFAPSFKNPVDQLTSRPQKPKPL